ncbi:MFS transporter [Conexibacter woesei]|uniref:Major facilitator superfamily MFS_1 n=1 Tax=Conexibacter woesei (strain DSM 14684 / CCUG 47730 / CIP 108061 / JCM 11494 / NBRC 100937 / ID131577) TaxID=469383 RepID=D3FDB7_CONWI|nr:MFS transporter [Conexibacter woesei]ADB53509.1 major facilitator superfamily MFS_1 [Conexibacter woesei DSM 14684]
MTNPYGELFKTPGALAFSAAGFVARMPISMIGIGLITMLSQEHGGFGTAGAIAATFTLSTALLGPLVSRLVDRFGQGRVLLPAAGISVIALGALLLCARWGAPTWTLFVFAALAGTLPNMSAMVRARWAHAQRGSSRLHTAFSLESVVDELTFVVGPALAVTLSTSLFAEAGPLVAAALLTIGVLLFVPQKRTEPPIVRDAAARAGTSAIRIGALRPLALMLLAGGTIVGTIDVVSIAFAEQQGSTASAGIVVALYAVGSGLAGLAFGVLRPTVPQPLLLVLGAAGTALTTLPLLVVDGIAALAATVFVAGLFFAPTMIVTMGLVERIVPAGQLTEGMTWVIAGLLVGVALGASVSGAIVDAHGPIGGFVVAIAAGAAMLLIALASCRPLLRATGAGDAAEHVGATGRVAQACAGDQ